MLKGLENIHKLFLNQQYQNNISYFEKIIEGIEYKKMYNHYIVVSCITTTQISQENFCSFIESQLDKELVNQLENFEEVDYCHIGLKTEKCGMKIDERKRFCTSWLLGIKFAQQTSYELSTKFYAKFEKIKETLINKFVLKNLGQRIDAKSEVKILVLKRNELENWGF
uniref:Poly(A) polymerase RNA-binding domain-containing protein n=1 Tax=Meloidogyne enterolobii TaxID=390850 RepID=A0A6V7VVD8_MELEN|nr:unnamed protein product [Meloidogyne enterolobii]